MSMATNFGRVRIYNDDLSSESHQKYFSCYITVTARPIATKLVEVVTYYKKLQPVKPDNPLNTWSHWVM